MRVLVLNELNDDWFHMFDKPLTSINKLMADSDLRNNLLKY